MRTLILGLQFLFFANFATAGDWPQILGPHRSGTADGETLPQAIPPGGFKKAWSVKVGAGYAGPIVRGTTAVLFHRVDDEERLEAFSVADGKSLWKADFPAHYRGGIDADKGPRCVPTATKDVILAFGAAGDLYCVNAADGKTRWVRELYSDFKGDEGYFGAGSAPIVIGDRVLVNVGGKKDAGLVALELGTGKTIWQRTSEAASYAAPTSVVRDGRELALFITRLSAVLVDPEKGSADVLFPFGARGPTVNAATPIVAGDHFFLTASYNVGAVWAKFDGRGAKPVWQNDDTLSSQYATPVYRDGLLFGIHGREDVGVAELRCVGAKTGDVQWSEPGFGVAHLILAGDKLLIVKVDGEVVLAAADAAKYRELGKFTALKGATRALPALAAGRLYLRTTTAAGGELAAFEVR